MAKLTLQDKFLNALIAQGEKEIKRLTRCIVVSRSAGGFYYIGCNGSLRYGETRTNSFPCGGNFKKALINDQH